MRVRSLHALGAAFLLAAPATAALAQDAVHEKPGSGFSFYQGDGLKTATFVATEMSFDGKIVKGAPYSAEAVTESIQTLADGNRIVRASTTIVYRDGEGRTRREQSMASIGPWTPAGAAGQMIFINDPVAGVNSILSPEKRTARKLPAPTFFVARGEGHASGGTTDVVVLRRGEGSHAALSDAQRAELEAAAAAARAGAAAERIPLPRMPVFGVAAGPAQAHGEPGVRFELRTPDDATKESLGKKAFDGVEADGTRTTITIPAGEIGNERPIEIVTEKWYSPELQTVVYSRHSDPRFGETIYRLTNINRTEPDASLFGVPSDYTIEESSLPRKYVVETKSIERRPAKRP